MENPLNAIGAITEHTDGKERFIGTGFSYKAQNFIITAAHVLPKNINGGPVFNDQGHLCGVICSNLPPSTNDDEHASYAAALWPLMATHTSHALFCFPPKVDKREIINITIMYLRDHPKKLGLYAPNLVIKAVRAAFPCKDGR